MEENNTIKLGEMTELNALENSTGVNFRDPKNRISDEEQDLIYKNSGNAVVIAQYIVKENPTLVRVKHKDAEGGALYRYNGRYYDYLDFEAIDSMVLDFCVKYNVTAAFKSVNLIRRALNVWREIASTPEMNPFPDLINLKNGVLNIHTKEFMSHNARFRFDYCLNVDYKQGDNHYSVYMKFLNDIFSGDQDTIANIIRIGGYLLDSSTKAKKCFFFDGNGGSGKSTLIDSFKMFFPDRPIRPVVSSLDLEELSGKGFDKEDLITSRFNESAETNKLMYNSEFLKKMVTGDNIKVSRKYDRAYTFRYQGKVILVGNGLPRFNDTSDGIYRRIMIFTFKNQYKEPWEIERIPHATERRIYPMDPDLPEKIQSEASAILNLFVEGLIDLRKNNYQFITSKDSMRAMDEFKKDSDTVRQFLEERYVIDFDAKEPLANIFNAFRAWYQDNVQDTRSMKFRSSEMSKRIKEVFNLDDCGREFFKDPQTGKYKRLTCYCLARKLNIDDLDELPTDDFDITLVVDKDLEQLKGI